MEIIIQAKQGNTVDFAFLNRQDPLHPYYQHICYLLRTGMFGYDSDSASQSEEEENCQKDIHTQNSHSFDTVSNAQDSTFGTSDTVFLMPQHTIIPNPMDIESCMVQSALYIAKEGEDKEPLLRETYKDDPHYTFLLPWDKRHLDYNRRVWEFKRKLMSGALL
jgi:hypothetical protein